jgi:hypothetical protein
MSEENEKSAPETTKVETEKALDVNQRVLKEAKEHKRRAQEAESELERLRQESMVKANDYTGLIESLQKKNAALEAEMKSTRSKVLKSNIRAKVAKYASDVYSVDDVLAQSEFKDILAGGINETDLDVDDAAVQKFVGEVLKAKPYLKKPQTMGVNTTKPNGVLPTGQASKNLAEMSLDELKNLARTVS